MNISVHPWILMWRIYSYVIPTVNRHLSKWKKRAQQIPDLELRKLALMSLETKSFNYESGAIYGLLAKQYHEEAIDFIVAYQIINHYLDNLCDRSTAPNTDDIRALHESIFHALTPGAKRTNYYRYHPEQEDGAYLRKLVKTCQDILHKMPAYVNISATLHELASYYCDLLIYKHIQIEERIPRLKAWYALYQDKSPPMRWYEFSASTESNLGILCLISYGFDKNFSEDMSQIFKKSYFPWIQGLHILLDDLIHQKEDHINGHLNFCCFYENQYEMAEKFLIFLQNANKSAAKLPDGLFHQMINQVLLGFYLADKKIEQQKEAHQMAKYLLGKGGAPARFFYLNRKIMAHLHSLRSLKADSNQQTIYN